MKKVPICAFVFFMFTSSAAFAGDKRFCGWIALDVGIKSSNIGAGAWLDKDKSLFNKKCKIALKAGKKGLKKNGLWDGPDWKKKDGYKCGHVSEFFTGSKNMCGKKGYMKKEEKAYLITKTGNDPAEFIKI